MNCLNNLIGISSICTPVVPTSGLYINNLPGMSLKIADSAADEEDVSGTALIQEKIQFSQKYIANNIIDFLKDKFEYNTIIENGVAGYYRSDFKTNPIVAGRLKGIRINIYDRPFLELNIQRIGIKLTSSITANVFVYDLMTGKLIDTIEIEALADEVVYIDINKSYTTNRQRLSLFFCIDQGEAVQYEASIGSGSSCRSCGNGNSVSSISTGYITSALQKSEANFVSQAGTGGLTIDYNISCSIEPLVCSMSNILAWPLLYKVGAEIMKEARYSRRLNSIVTIDKADNEELLSYYESEYLRSMNQITSNIKMPDDICVRCNAKIIKVTQLP